MQTPTDPTASLIDTPEGRRALALASPSFFDTYYCGMVYADHRTKWLEKMESEYRIAKATGRKRKILFMAPRDHGKSETGVTFVTRRVCLDRNIRILWVSVALAPAQKRFTRIQNLLRSKRVTEDWTTAPEEGFGPFRVTEQDKWTTTQVYVHRTKLSIDPTIEAVGSGGAVTGGHFDIIIIDDLEDDKTCQSKTLRDKTKEWFRGTLEPMLTDGGLLVAIGNKKHADDIYTDMENNPTFSVIKDPAIKKWPEEFEFDKVIDDQGREMLGDLHVTGDYEVLWPGQGEFCRDIDKLLRMRTSIGPTMFAREFQHQVIDDATAAFRRDDLQRALARGSNFCLYKPPPGVPLDVVQGWDLSLVADVKAAEQKDRDYTVGITLGRDTTNGDRYLLGVVRRRGLSQKQMEAVIQAEYDRFMDMGLPPRLVAIEKNNFGNIIVNSLFDTTSLPLAPHQTGSNKSDPWEGVPSLSLLFENSKFILPSHDIFSVNMCEELITELHGLGRERHDDMVMALWIAECVLRPKAGGAAPLGKIAPRVGRREYEGDAGEQPHPLAKRVLTNKGWKWRIPTQW